jgi:hypothetical protein
MVALALTRGLFGGVAFQLGDVTAVPGEAHVLVPITFTLDAGDPPITGWQLSVRYDPAIVDDALIYLVREADFFNRPNPAHYADPGVVGAAVVYALLGPEEGRVVTSTEVVAYVSVCLRDTASAGAHPIEILPVARRTAGAPELVSVYSALGETRFPELEEGEISVAGAPVVQECTREGPPVLPPPPPPLPPRPWTASFALADASAGRGDEFAVPFTVRGSAEVRGFSFSIDFDETLLAAVDIEDLLVKPDGSPADFRLHRFDNEDATPGSSGVAEGYFVGAVVISLDDPFDYYLARDTDHQIALLHLRVKEEAPPTTTEISFIDGALPAPNGQGQPVANIVTIVTESVEPEPFDSVLFISAAIEIVGDASAFRRGDADMSGDLELTDAQYTLNFLFLGGPEPPCRDAADVTDDGALNISDPVHLLNYLYLGGPAPAPPLVGAGLDPTPDVLRCEDGVDVTEG